MIVLQQSLHFFLHLIFPALIAWYFFKSNWRNTYMVFLLTMIVDLDHVFAEPIFDPSRCSIGFHPLHTDIAILFYLILLFIPKCRVIALGLLMHMITDFIDCQFMPE